MPLERVIRVATDAEAYDDRRDLAYCRSRPPEERIRHVEELRRQSPGYCDSSGAPHRIDRSVWLVGEIDAPDGVLGRHASPRP